MDDAGSVTAWLLEAKAGDPLATQALWNRYYERLVCLARKKLADSPRRVVDEDDVALSALDSFCRGAAEGRFPQLRDRDELWRLLVTITVRKALNQRKHLQRAKRGGGHVRGESALADAADVGEPQGFALVVGSEPSPDLAALVADELSHMVRRLGDESLRKVAVWKLEGFANEEIAEKLGCKLRTVERKLQLIRSVLSRRQSS
ncbi:MAG TPA: ECF-type sigma factor [Pirellulales bacterium]|jgi:DNA-directed RNA polymerase specialized sigma24 family protein|nr:ECF-type sigma factor [Pirellulales bacterium]